MARDEKKPDFAGFDDVSNDTDFKTVTINNNVNNDSDNDSNKDNDNDSNKDSDNNSAIVTEKDSDNPSTSNSSIVTDNTNVTDSNNDNDDNNEEVVVRGKYAEELRAKRQREEANKKRAYIGVYLDDDIAAAMELVKSDGGKGAQSQTVNIALRRFLKREGYL